MIALKSFILTWAVPEWEYSTVAITPITFPCNEEDGSLPIRLAAANNIIILFGEALDFSN